MARLVYMERSGRQKIITLAPHRSPLTIGRHPDCDLQLPDASISRRHCEIRSQKGVYSVNDLRSANGTRVNDLHTEAQTLQGGDIIRCGSVILQFFDDATLPDTADPPKPPPPDPVVDDSLTTLGASAKHASSMDLLHTHIRSLEGQIERQEAQIRAMLDSINEGRITFAELGAWLRGLLRKPQ